MFLSQDKKIFKIFFFSLLYAILNGYFFNFINDNFIHFENKKYDDFSKNEMFFISVVFAPVMETIFCQLLLYKFLRVIKIKNDNLNIFIMSFIFSQLHWFHWNYVVMVFFSSLALNYLYVKVFKLKNELIAFILTVLLHSLYNLYGFLFVN